MRILKLLPLGLFTWYESRILQSYESTLSFAKSASERMLETISEKKLEHAFKRGLKTPAYVDFLKGQNIKPRPMRAGNIKKNVPATDKNNYIKKYSYEARCVSGAFPDAGNIDESSGSSGTPTNWIRSYDEEALLLKACRFEYKYSFKPSKQVIMISAWSSGPWATGVKFCELTEHFSLVKNTGTDINSIKRTIKTFGKNYHYIIAGYPIFLQSLFEERFPWKEYDIDIVTGGDGYSAVWPKKIKAKIKAGSKIVSSYGCSDIDIGIGFETPFSQAVREEAAHNSRLSAELFGGLQTTPMLFQYNPTLHYVQNLEGGEFVITHLDPYVISPKIKYNIHDIGGGISFSRIKKAVKDHAPHIYELHKDKDMLRLPFLYIAGRSDGTLSFDGGNVYPEQLDIIFTRHAHEQVNNFKMVRKEKQKQPFHVLIELRRGTKRSKELKQKIEHLITERLPLLNKDYGESLENNKKLVPSVELYSLNQGPFKKDKKRIKYKYVE